LRWDHQKSDEFEATLRLNGEVLTGGLESNLKFARLLATDFGRDLKRNNSLRCSHFISDF